MQVEPETVTGHDWTSVLVSTVANTQDKTETRYAREQLLFGQ
jgi:hypothetical protein